MKSTLQRRLGDPFEGGAGAALQRHWPEYLMEAAELGVFLICACVVVALLEHPDSAVRQAIVDPTARRVLTGMAMGLTAIAIVYSPWGKQSGAHFNPAVTLTFWWLGKVATWDAVFYVAAQFAGAIAGVGIAGVVLGEALAHPAVNYVATVPGSSGTGAAFVAEGLISGVLMTVVLRVSNTPRLAPYTGLFAGILVATYISLEAPFSGMSMNPARSLAPALFASAWDGLWVYFTAPPLGMGMAAWIHRGHGGGAAIACAKLDHQSEKRCIFCGTQASRRRSGASFRARRSSLGAAHVATRFSTPGGRKTRPFLHSTVNKRLEAGGPHVRQPL